MNKKILLADDEQGYWDLFKCLFEPLGCQVAWAKDGDEILKMINEQEYDLILLDVNMPRSHAPVMVKKIRQVRLEQKIVIWSSQSDPYLVTEKKVTEEESLSCLFKPVEVNEIYRIVFEELGEEPMELKDQGEK